MLFNTLVYARFFALVFVLSWALRERRLGLLLPFFALIAYVAQSPSGLGLFVSAAALMGTVGALWKAKSETNAAPRGPIVLLQLALVGAGLLLLGFQKGAPSPTGFFLALLGVQAPLGGALSWLLAALGLVTAYYFLTARKVRLLFLLGASYVFYAHWDYRFLPLIWGSSTADFWLAKWIHRAETPKKRQLLLLATVILNLGVLGFFKYANFGIDTATAALRAAGFAGSTSALEIALPVGISFFTFESMSYVIDVSRRELAPHESYVEYLTFVAFFPHLVAGPIVRPRDLLPQLAAPARFVAAEASEGLFLIGVGLAKKLLIGDYLALNLIDRVFDAPLMYSALEIYAATVGYALQIYCDFSGYTDIAIGSALLLGVRFPLNFRSPYKAHNIVDFWRRWHISLSTWLRDYLYVPLGGNRKGRARSYWNLLITMLLGGLWHGASWTFVVWGLLHGVALAITKWWTGRRGATDAPDAPVAASELSLGRRAMGVLFTFHLVCLGWLFFRAESFAQASLLLSQLGTCTLQHKNLAAPVVAALVIGMGSHFVPDRLFEQARSRFCSAPYLVQALLLGTLAVLLRKLASADSVPFVYFQF